MTILKAMARELLGLFMEDEFLAIGILFVVGATAVLTKALSINGPAAGAGLLVGCICVLAVGVRQTAMFAESVRRGSHQQTLASPTRTRTE